MNNQGGLLRKKADSLYSRVILARDRYCLIDGHVATDAHHIVPQGLSEFLRYDLKNGVGLCLTCRRRADDCHPFALSILAGKIGIDRIGYLTEHRRAMVVLDVAYLTEAVRRLKKELRRYSSH